MHRENWDDLRFVIAVAETGSVSAAARRLGVTHGTVLRRVAVFEERLGTPLFARGSTGYSLLPGHEAVLDAAHEVENAVVAVERVLTGSAHGLRGKVRITSTDTFCVTVLPDAIARIYRTHPELDLSLISSNAPMDFARSAVDLTVRPAPTLPEGLVGEHVADLGIAVYATPDAPPRWLALDGPLARSLAAKWQRARIDETSLGPGSDSFLVLREMLRAGLGRAFLPCILGDASPDLQRLTTAAPQIDVPIWVACLPELAGSSRMRAVRRALADALMARAGALAGRPDPRAESRDNREPAPVNDACNAPPSPVAEDESEAENPCSEGDNRHS